MSDYLVRGIGFGGEVRVFAVRSTETVAEAQRRHNTWPVVSADAVLQWLAEACLELQGTFS